MYAEAKVGQLESLGDKRNLLRSCIHKLPRYAIQSLDEIWKARQESIRKKQVNPSEIWVGVGGVSLGWGAGGMKGIRAGELAGHRTVEPNILRTLEDRATCSFRASTVSNCLQLALPSTNMAYYQGAMLQSPGELLDCLPISR